MTMDNTHIHHAIDYIEFSVADLAQAKAFYSAAFDWQFNDYGPGYAGIRKPGSDAESGGLAVTEEVKTGGPLVVVYSTNIEQSLDRVVQAGGRITQPIFEFPGGHRFQFEDPSGNELAVWATLT